MKRTLLLGWLLFLTVTVRAQFYAPETEFHDRAQRTFPVEAARILAWQQNGTGADIAEITFQFEIAEHDHVWHIQWLDEQKKVLRERTVRYSPALLVSGPGFFREVFRQLAGDDWRPRSAQPATAGTAFWEGATLAGVSRLEALAAANQQIARTPHPATAADAARLAGTLVHGSVPLLGNAMTLDALNLSRAAAWLCTAEDLAEAPDDAAWVPILFLSGRERFAQAAWRSGHHDGDLGSAARFWDLMVQLPSVKDCFLFAAQKGNEQFAFPAMLFPAEFEVAYTQSALEVADEIIGKDKIPRLYEYGPNVAARGQENGARWGARMLGLAMGTWLDEMAVFQPPPRDFTGYQPILKTAATAADAAGPSEAAAIEALAPVLNLGLDENRGPLIPVAVVTARDLLGYGWELAGLQFGYAYSYAANTIGEHDAAKRITKPVFENIKGLDPFFWNATLKPRFPLEDLRRVQFMGSSLVDTATMHHLPPEWKYPRDSYLCRRWLVRGGATGVDSAIRGEGEPIDFKSLIQRMLYEGGPTAVCYLLNHDGDIRFPQVVDDSGLREELVRELPWNYEERDRLAYAKFKGPHLDPAQHLELAQALEKIGWDALRFRSPFTIFEDYVHANADESARRFYDEVRPFLRNSNLNVKSNPTAAGRYVLAWIEGDEATQKQIMDDAEVASMGDYYDLHFRVIHALVHGQIQEAQDTLDTTNQRFGNVRETNMREYLPLIPALLDVNHADHAKAVASFPEDKGWLFLRWALAKKAALPASDVVLLFHKETKGEEGIFAVAAQGDRDRVRELYKSVTLEPMERILIIHEFLREEGSTPLKGLPDLKPAGAAPLVDLVREELRRQKRQN